FIDLANWEGTTTVHHALAPALGTVAMTKRLSMPINDYADGILHWTAEPLFIPTGGGGSPAALRTAVFDPPGENLKFGPTQNRDYRWADNTEPDSPAFQWVDAKALGSQLGLGSFAQPIPVTLPFPFTYYGNTFTGLNVNFNGWASFSST